ncbi:hypothetical protein [Xanthomonas bonasiae]|uniref:hypothetical protein n=1 Tax=Xanthomonas bonasiae TaxID=2810351 RepID=UPI00197D9573|nr:hypothetical protein [Xanthomonas bonasiae]MBN6110003.1 hypothetical protein [Xanthomonas bonasiae]
MKAILHVGQIKTGSSALQRAFFDNAELLLEHGVLYPLDGATETRRMDGLVTRDHNLLAACGVEFDTLYQPLAQRYGNASHMAESVRSFQDSVCRRMGDTGCSTLLLSAEFLAAAPIEVHAAIKRWLQDEVGVDEILASIYVRSPESAYASRIAQDAKAGIAFVPPSEFLLDYRADITRLVDIYGEAHLDVREYHNARFERGDIVRDFSSRLLGFSLEGARVNESLSIEELYFLAEHWRKWGGAGPHGKTRFELLVSWLECNPFNAGERSKPVLRPDIARYLLGRHQSQIAYLEQWGVGFETIAAHETFTMPQDCERVEQAFAQPDEQRLGAFKSFVIDGLLHACVVMNQSLASRG